MRKLKLAASVALALTALTALTLFIGCEDEPGVTGTDTYFDANAYQSDLRSDGELPLLLSPIQESVTIVGQRIAFRAKGGTRPITWSVSSSARGSINTVGLRTDYALYEVKAVADNSVQAIDADGRAAVAAVRAGTDALRITPSSLTLLRPGAGPAGDFVVTGGVPPYSEWIETFPELGVVSLGGTYIVMTALVEGTNFVSITDAAGDIATATVNHVLEYDPLAIIPESTALATDGDTANFIASGGLPPYQWSLVYNSQGQIVGSDTGTVMLYRRLDEGDQVIILEDALGSFTQAQVAQAAPTPPVIQPSNVTLATNETTFAFAVTGGTPPFSWLVLTGTGSLTPNTGTAVVYTRGVGNPPNNYIIRVTDSASQSALATITQE
ncbi:MAG: hypothetical protein HQ523_03705 [Lentisphaerae bacterium]|nr:hypothetical protein [Lentisphaerota bacterium]